MFKRMAAVLFGCLVLGHKYETVVAKWLTWGYSHRKKKFAHRKHRRTFVRCIRCGKILKEESEHAA
jgi:hypothetical protein